MHNEGYPEVESADTDAPSLETLVVENSRKLDELVEWVTIYVRQQTQAGLDRLLAENAKTAGNVAKLASDLEGAENRRASRIEDTFNAFQRKTSNERKELIERIEAVEKVKVCEDETEAKLADMTRRVLVDDNRIIALGATIVRLESRLDVIGDVTQTHTRMFMGIMRGVEEAIPQDEGPDDPPPPPEPPKPKPPDESTLQPMDFCTIEAYLCFSGDNPRAILDACNLLSKDRVRSWLRLACIVTGHKPSKSPTTLAYPVVVLRTVAGYLKGLWHPSQPKLSRNGLINHILTSELASRETTGNGKA